MRLSINLSLMIFLGVFTISELAQSQRRPNEGSRWPDSDRPRPSWPQIPGEGGRWPDQSGGQGNTRPVPMPQLPIPQPPHRPSPTVALEGITGVRTGADGNIELDFRFACNNNQARRQKTTVIIVPGGQPRPPSPPRINYCPSTLIDDDGLGSVVAVLSEMRREAQCDHRNISAADWRVIRSFLEERVEHLKTYCHRVICNNGPNHAFRGQGGAPDINIMEDCGRTTAHIEQFLRRNNGSAYSQVAPLLQLFHEGQGQYRFPPERYHSYATIHNGRQSNTLDSVLTRKNDNRTPIANHHSKIKDDTNVTTYFRTTYGLEGVLEGLCHGVRQGRLADLLRQRRQPRPFPPTPPGSGGRGGRGTH